MILEFRILLTACEQDAGKYMVKAVNDAGEAHGIADFIILEPTPDGMTEIVKTVAPENIEGQTVRQFVRLIFFHPILFNANQSI